MIAHPSRYVKTLASPYSTGAIKWNCRRYCCLHTRSLAYKKLNIEVTLTKPVVSMALKPLKVRNYLLMCVRHEYRSSEKMKSRLKILAHLKNFNVQYNILMLVSILWGPLYIVWQNDWLADWLYCNPLAHVHWVSVTLFFMHSLKLPML